MNLSTFFEHWQIIENPFRGEEARHDPVFARLQRSGEAVSFSSGTGSGGGLTEREGGRAKGEGTPNGSGGTPYVAGAATGEGAGRSPSRLGTSMHSDFEKIAGDFDRPSTSIVFGEKGSGKTAIRLQLAEKAAEHNARHPDARVLLVAYDDLNPVLDRFSQRVREERPSKKRSENGDRTDPVVATFNKFRLVDHMDAVLNLIVPRLVDTLLEPSSAADGINLGREPRKAARKLDLGLRRDILLLQALYDRAETADERTAPLRRVLRLPFQATRTMWAALAYAGWAVPAAIAGAAWYQAGMDWNIIVQIVVGALLLAWLAALIKYAVGDRYGFQRLGRRIRRQIRVTGRSESSYARSLMELDAPTREESVLPLTDSDEQRYAMLDRLRRVLRAFGYSSTIIVIDRVDEPTLISGEPERMRAVIWPLLNNKFLTQNGIGVKMLLPIELRHALFRESAAFFQEARLDKQNLIERLSWSGAMLYDLCNARLRACRAPGAEPISLIDLFAEDVTRQDLVDALDQMHQPRDAFKMLYQCLVEHCSNVTEEQAQWQIPRLVLESIRKDQAERVRQLYRGVRPA